MAGPAWLADSFAALMLLTALYCAPGPHPDPAAADRAGRSNLVHVLMGMAMAGMLTQRCAGTAGAAGRRDLGLLWPGLRRGHGVVRGPDRAVLPGHRHPAARWAATTCRT